MTARRHLPVALQYACIATQTAAELKVGDSDPSAARRTAGSQDHASVSSRIARISRWCPVRASVSRR